MIEVKVIRIPGAVSTVALEDNATVTDALNAINIEVGDNEALKLNGVDASPDNPLSNGDKVIIAKGAKGNL